MDEDRIHREALQARCRILKRSAAERIAQLDAMTAQMDGHTPAWLTKGDHALLPVEEPGLMAWAARVAITAMLTGPRSPRSNDETARSLADLRKHVRSDPDDAALSVSEWCARRLVEIEKSRPDLSEGLAREADELGIGEELGAALADMQDAPERSLTDIMQGIMATEQRLLDAAERWAKDNLARLGE